MKTKNLQKFILLAVLAGCTVSAIAEQPDQSRRIEQLVNQLDADSFRDRERAHRQLVEIGVPATSAIRKATMSKSIEMRYRAQIILGHLMSLEIQGVWQSDDQLLIILGSHWWCGTIDDPRPAEYDKNSFRIVHVGDESRAADLLVGLGGRKGQICKALFRRDGDTLHYSGSYDARPTGLNDGSGYEVPWNRAKDECALRLLREAAKLSEHKDGHLASALLRQLQAETSDGDWRVIVREGIGGDLATIVLAEGKLRLIYEGGQEFEGQYFIRKISSE